MHGIDENGWAIGPVTALAIADAWSLISPEAEGRVDAARWQHQARTFFSARLSLADEKRYPTGAVPLVDAVAVDVARAKPEDAPATRVRVVTFPLDRTPLVRKAAEEGAAAIGGAGMDVLVGRGRRAWQVEDRVDAGGDDRAPLLVAAVLASLFLAPIVPPGGGTILGVKSARERLASRGWR